MEVRAKAQSFLCGADGGDRNKGKTLALKRSRAHNCPMAHGPSQILTNCEIPVPTNERRSGIYERRQPTTLRPPTPTPTFAQVRPVPLRSLKFSTRFRGKSRSGS